jgi:hypothetical protein
MIGNMVKLPVTISPTLPATPPVSLTQQAVNELRNPIHREVGKLRLAKSVRSRNHRDEQ